MNTFQAVASPSTENREVTLLAWRARMQRVTDWLIDHLDQPFDLDRLAELAHFSPYHFHRVYSVAMGEPVAETVRRMRLHRAAVMLATPIKLFAIAKKAGCGRVQVVGRVFRAACRLRRGSRLFAFPSEKNPAKMVSTKHVPTSCPRRRCAAHHY